MELVQTENRLWTNNGQFVLRPSSLTRLSERFHTNQTHSLKKNKRSLFFSFILVKHDSNDSSCISNSVAAPQRRITIWTQSAPGMCSNNSTGHPRCRLSYQCFILLSLSLCFLLIKTTDSRGTVSVPAVIKAGNNSKHLDDSKVSGKKKHPTF